MTPDNADYMTEAAWSAINVGNVQLNGVRDFDGAERSYRVAISRFERALRVRPRDESLIRAWANAYGWLADSFYMRQQWRQALEARLRQHGIVERLHRADPANLENAFRLAIAHRAVAVALLKVGDTAAARPHMINAHSWSVRLARSDPRNAEWLLFRAQVGCELYYRDIGLPAGLSRAELAGDIRATKAELDRQHNPQAAEIANCVGALG